MIPTYRSALSLALVTLAAFAVSFPVSPLPTHIVTQGPKPEDWLARLWFESLHDYACGDRFVREDVGHTTSEGFYFFHLDPHRTAVPLAEVIPTIEKEYTWDQGIMHALNNLPWTETL